MDKVFPEFEFDWLIDTIKRNLPKELDFVQEGQNCEHVSRLFNDTPFMKVLTLNCLINFVYLYD